MPPDPAPSQAAVDAAEEALRTLAFGLSSPPGLPGALLSVDGFAPADAADPQSPTVDARYQTLVEQLPAVVFMAFLDRGTGEAYVSPHIEQLLDFTRQEWLEDPVRWYQHIHPEDKERWSTEAASLLFSGEPLRSVYRVLARDGRIVWFHCEAKMVRSQDGRPWFIHGVAFDITDVKEAEMALQDERNFVSAIVDTVAALVLVQDPQGRIVRFNRACEDTTGYRAGEVQGRCVWDLFATPSEIEQTKTVFTQLLQGRLPGSYDSHWTTREGATRLITWSHALLRDAAGKVAYVIATGIDVTDRKQLEGAILDASEREQRRIGRDLHDGLGQHLTGIAFLSKVLEQRLRAHAMPDEAAQAAQLARLVNQSIVMTRELSHGLLPVQLAAHGLMSALQHLAGEIHELFSISCRFSCEDPLFFHDVSIATHLFRIAQEAVTNALRHGHATDIEIGLLGGDQPTLTITDNGVGCPAVEDLVTCDGMGLRIMRHRAAMIGGMLSLLQPATGGTSVVCRFPYEH